ncbi:MAG: PQQ-dependent sugar dehydrogenase [Acidobacteria bacterium]|nr:PQQ-dependent sugar dehydrogenase [Acidobacteriota bacterium]
MTARTLLVALALLLQPEAQACRPSPTPPADPAPTPQPTPIPTEIFTAPDGTRFGVQVIVRGVEVPWSLAFAPDGRLFVTERAGRVRLVINGSLVGEPALRLGDVSAVGEAGLLGITLHPDFAENHLVYLVYTATRPGGSPVNRLVRFREVNNVLAEPVVLLDGMAAASIHDGARVRFGPDRRLYLTMGDAASPSVSQDLGSLNGKILRLNDDGSTPADNPFASPIYSYGHRNPQGIDWNPMSGDLWETEHGATGNDEVNLIQAGHNYGWPTIQGTEQRPGMDGPVLLFNPSIAPSGASFYAGSALPAFRNNLFFTTLRGVHLHRVRFDPADPQRVLAQERLLEGRYGRLRDVVTGPDGFLYFCTSNRDGRGSPIGEDDRILRIVPPS